MGEARDNTADGHIENLKKVIANFERVREEMIARRRGMSDSAMVVIDDGLTVNARTVDALKRALAIAESDRARKEKHP